MTIVNPRRRAQSSFALGGKCQYRLDVLGLELREVSEQLRLRHAARQVLEDVRYGLLAVMGFYRQALAA